MNTEKEVMYEENIQLVSTTDLNSVITYANQNFCNIAGYTQNELIDQTHNLVRHPDMPKEAFGNMWTDLKANKSWRGIVKNRCKNGDYYWVDAYVTPIYEHGEKTGYQSVRTKPTRTQIEKTISLYQKINNGKLMSQLKRKSIFHLFFIQHILLALVINLGLFFTGYVDTAIILILVFTQLIATIPIFSIKEKLKKLQTHSLKINNNPLIQKVFSDNMNEIGTVESSLSMLEAQNRTLLGRLDDYAGLIKNSVTSTKEAVERSNEGSQQIEQQVEMVSSAVSQSASATEEISHSINATSQASKDAYNAVTQSIDSVSKVTSGIGRLNHDMSETAEKTSLLQTNTDDIESILSIISQIAEQTNLLALNAAIEAARAGEQGRGFAVVADEVRNLASKTQTSTQEIHTAIAEVQSAVKQTVDNITKNRKDLETLSNDVENTLTLFSHINEMMDEVSDRSIQVASAAEEQSSVAVEIQKNVLSIQDNAKHNKNAAKNTAQECTTLDKLAANLDSIVTAFR